MAATATSNERASTTTGVGTTASRALVATASNTAVALATRLTSDGISDDPWWTNDGRTLFFSKTPKGQPAQTWRWQAGSARQVQQGLWSPDGTAADYASGFGYFGRFHRSSLFALAPAALPPAAAEIA